MIGSKALLSAGLFAVALSASAFAQESGGDSSAEQIFRVFEALTTDGSEGQQQTSEPQTVQKSQPVQAQQVQLKEPNVTIIPATQIRPAPATLNSQDIDQLSIDKRGIGGGSHAGNVIPPEPLSFSIELTPRNPSKAGKGHMKYEYPNNVFINDDQAYAMFSKYNMPGMLRYSARLEKGKRYLIEVEVEPSGSSGGGVQHILGGNTSKHELGKFNEIVNVSRVVQPSESGWINGIITQDYDNPASYWKVYRVKIEELD